MTASIQLTPTPQLQYLLRLGDTCLILGQRLGEWCGHGPILEEDIALTNMALDLIGQARALLTRAGQTEGRAFDEDQLAYLRDERPKTRHRMVFARHMTPRERPIGPDRVRKTIRQAYARAGLPYTRSHLLRHTMANRLLAGGSSLKEVADVLRHRSLNTTMIYAKLDSRNLAAVALPWPGSAA
mgnify:CR=1 FL=1